MLQTKMSQAPVPITSLNFFNLPKPSSRTMARVFTQPLTEMRTRKPGDKVQLSLKADNPTAICLDLDLENVGFSTSHNPMDLQRLLKR
jgi:hypothetical protein